MNSASRSLSSIKHYARASTALSAVVISVLAVSYAGCSKNDAKPAENNCTGAQALSKAPLQGASLPLKTLSLTFDDGPGVRTRELSTYLKEQGIRATFFVWGNAITNHGAGQTVLAQLVSDGHLVANHTETHRSLTSQEPVKLTDAEIVEELTKVDTAIATHVKDNKWLFRPPFGQFDDKTFAALDKSPMKKYVGPILWNMGGTHAPPAKAADTECWKTAMSAEACGDAYMSDIVNIGSGIVLLHDPYFTVPNDPTTPGTFQMVQYLVPKLKAAGYKFVRVDEVPDIAALLPGGNPADGGTPGTDGGGTTSGDPGTTSGGTTDPVDPCL